MKTLSKPPLRLLGSSLKARCVLAGLAVGWLMLAEPARLVAWADVLKPAPIRGSEWDVGVRAQLQAMVNAYGFHSINHFCIVWYPGSSKDDFAGPYVYWPTQDKFIVWGVGSNLILESTDYFDIQRDVLADGVDLTSTYPHRGDVTAIVRDCRIHGNAYTIKKTIGGWVPIGKFDQFLSAKQQLQFLVDDLAPTKVNKFCVVGQKDGPFLAAYVYWQTQNKLILWLPDPNDGVEPSDLAYMPVQIDTRHDLRDTEDAQDYRNEMQRSYALSILQACQKVGEDYVVNKSK